MANVFGCRADWVKIAVKHKSVEAVRPVCESRIRIRSAPKLVVEGMTAPPDTSATTWPVAVCVSMTGCSSRQQRQASVPEIVVCRRMRLRFAKACFVLGKYKPPVGATALGTTTARLARVVTCSRGLEKMVPHSWWISALNPVNLGAGQDGAGRVPFAWGTKSASVVLASTMSAERFAATAVIAPVERSAHCSPSFWILRPLEWQPSVCPHKAVRSQAVHKRVPLADNRPIAEALAVSYRRARIRAFALIAAAVIPNVQAPRFA